MTSTTPYELLEIRDLAENYSDRQGLRVVPMAVAVLLQALPAPWRGDWQLLAMVAGIAGYPLVGRYYRARFGHVDEHPHPGPAFPAQAALTILLLFMVMAFDAIVNPPLFVSGLAVALWLIHAAWPSRTIRAHYLVLGIALAVLSFAPLAGVTHRATAVSYGIVFGVALLVNGIVEHVRFVRLLRGRGAHE